MAGAILWPHNTTAAIAKPVGGQMGVALGLIEASRRPRWANVKYASPTRISAKKSGWNRGALCPSLRTLMAYVVLILPKLEAQLVSPVEHLLRQTIPAVLVGSCASTPNYHQL